ncbi:MAG: nitrite/sulfite reductase, partial [Candidatus Acidiferrales bacterium]
MSELKETKAQRVERLKREKNPWLHLGEIRDFARRGHSSIPPEWLSTYFRPWGVYTQGDGQGVTGGTGGEGRAVPFFMVRIRIPNGLLTTRQVRTIADLSEQHGNGVADITVRQNIQLHWIRIESLPDLFDQLHSVGLSTTGACGDVTRNITGCPLAGLHAAEIADVSPVALAIDQELAGNPDFYNLPRKFKITVTACPDWCSYPEINDIALTATRRPLCSAGFQPAAGEGLSRHSDRSDPAFSFAPLFAAPGRGARFVRPVLFAVAEESRFNPNSSSSLEVPGRWSHVAGRPSPTNHDSQITNHELGFSLRVAGGLSAEPHLAVRLNAFIRQDQVIPVIRAITEVFRESQVLRQSRERARLKYLFLEHGWTPDSFLAAIQARLPFVLDPAEPEALPAQIHRDHLGVQAQKQPGLFSIGASVIRGRITPAQLHLAADLAERFADGHIRTTPMQNLLLVNVPEAHVPGVVSALAAAGLPVESSPFVRGTVACTGSEFCKLALTETKSFARWLTEQLEDRFPGFREDIKLHITGCPNSCGQHWIADIGIEGKKIKLDGKFVDAYYFCVGGAVGQFASIARPVGYRCRAEEVPDAIARLLRTFYAERSPHDTLQHFLSTQSTNSLRAILAGGPAS